MILYMETDRTKYRLPIYVTDSFDDLAEHAGLSKTEIKHQMYRAKKKGKESRFLIVDCEDVTTCSKCLHNLEDVCSNDLSHKFGENVLPEDFCVDWEKKDGKDV